MDYRMLFRVLDLACMYLKVQNRRVLGCRPSQASNFLVLNLCVRFPARGDIQSLIKFVKRIYKPPLLVKLIFLLYNQIVRHRRHTP